MGLCVVAAMHLMLTDPWTTQVSVALGMVGDWKLERMRLWQSHYSMIENPVRRWRRGR